VGIPFRMLKGLNIYLVLLLMLWSQCIGISIDVIFSRYNINHYFFYVARRFYKKSLPFTGSPGKAKVEFRLKMDQKIPGFGGTDVFFVMIFHFPGTAGVSYFAASIPPTCSK